MNVVRAVLLKLFHQIMRIYFRDIEVVGYPAPSTSRRLFAANHVNAMVDPMLVMTTADCSIAPVAKATLWNVPGLRLLLEVAEAVPVVRRQDDPSKAAGANDEVFQRVAGHLVRGGNILIFPEGISHNEPHVMPLRGGAGRMLAEAHARGVRGLTFQTIGLEFEARETFRSRALVLYGPVRSVDALGLEGESLAHAITEQLRIDLPSLIVEGTSAQELRLIARVAELLAHETGDASLAAWNSVGRQVEAARKALTELHAPITDELAAKVHDYYAHLAASDMTDLDVFDEHGFQGRRARHRLGLVILAPLAIVGALLYVIPYQLPKLAPLLAKTERDVISTYKLGISLLAFPLWAALLLVLSLVLLPSPISLVAALVVLVSPLAALPWLDEIDRVQSRTAEVERTGVCAVEKPQLLELRKAAMGAIAQARSRLEHLEALLPEASEGG